GGLTPDDLTPSQVVAIDDEWNVRTKGLSTEKRTILELHRQGHTSDEIAAKTDRSSRGIRRVIQQLREMFGYDSDSDAKRSDRHKPSEDGSNGDASR
ncbi:MAG: HTH domain-containing protein, partial [Planctomycetota bacterium]|nr:HTH domain-containing protein [Planctomycetota bacterium]